MSLDQRLAQLERTNRIQSRCLTGLGLALVVGLSSSALGGAAQEDVPDVLRARRIEVLDRSGGVVVELMGEGLDGESGVIYVYNGDGVPAGQVRIPSASLSSDGGGQLDLYGHRGDGEATLSVEQKGRDGWSGQLRLSDHEATTFFSVGGSTTSAYLHLFNDSDESGVVLRSGTPMPVEIRGRSGDALLEIVEASEDEGGIELYRKRKAHSLRVP